LNIYSEADRPQDFFVLTTSIIIFVAVFIAAAIGYLGYLAFGSTTKSVILYNLPNHEPLSITAKCLYIFTIMGSFVIVIQPIYYVIERTEWYEAIGGISARSAKEKAMKKEGEEKKEEGEGEMMEEDKMMEAAGEDMQMMEEAEGEKAKSGGAGSADSADEDIGCCNYLVFILVRLLVVALIVLCAFQIPNINVMLTLNGAILGTIVNVWLPVLFYNRAYNWSEKNQKFQRKDGEDQEPLMKMEENKGEDGEGDDQEMMMEEVKKEGSAENKSKKSGEEEEPRDPSHDDPRGIIKCTSWIVLVVGTIIGIIGLVYVMIELFNGDEKEDSVD